MEKGKAVLSSSSSKNDSSGLKPTMNREEGGTSRFHLSPSHYLPHLQIADPNMPPVIDISSDEDDDDSTPLAVRSLVDVHEVESVMQPIPLNVSVGQPSGEILPHDQSHLPDPEQQNPGNTVTMNPYASMWDRELRRRVSMEQRLQARIDHLTNIIEQKNAELAARDGHISRLTTSSVRRDNAYRSHSLTALKALQKAERKFSELTKYGPLTAEECEMYLAQLNKLIAEVMDDEARWKDLM